MSIRQVIIYLQSHPSANQNLLGGGRPQVCKGLKKTDRQTDRQSERANDREKFSDKATLPSKLGTGQQ